jgi:alkyl hydroperoxide reductase subunit AhpC
VATNTANQITILQSLQTVINNIETFAANWRCGDPNIDNQTVMLFTTRLDTVMNALLTTGSRAQQLATSQARSTNNNAGAGVAADIQYKIVDDFMRTVATQIAVLQNPAQTPRRVHTAGQ